VSVLARPKHEVMAKALAEGKTQEQAYTEAGYKSKWPDRAASDMLKKHPEIKARAQEIRFDADVRAQRIIERAAEQAAVSKAYVLSRLHEMAERCMQHRPVLNMNGEQVYVETPEGKIAPAYTFDAKGARGALHLIGLELGMFVQRVRFEKTPFDDLPAETMQQIVANLIALKQGRVIDHKPNAVPALPDAEPAAGVGVDRRTPA
jgi:hypothetical protein